MSFLLDPIESGINDLLDPLTSVFAPPSASTARTAQSTETTGNSQSTTASQDTPTATAVSFITPSATVAPSTASVTQSSPTSEAETTTSRSTRIASSTTSSIPSTVSSSTQTTLSTSTTSRSSLSASSPVPITTSAPAAPSAAPPLLPAQSNSHDTTAHSEPGISTAGIVVAIVFAVALLASTIWLTFRFCPPIRRRIDAWSSKGREKRSYRKAIDGPAPPEKDDTNSFSSHGSQQRKSVSAQAAERIGVGKRPFSFFGIGANPNIEQKSGYSWRVESASGPVHQQYVSPNSADTPRGDGLGLGRVSLLRNHSLLRKAGYDVPVPVPPEAGARPNITQTPSQTETAGVGKAHKPKLIPLQTQLRQSQHQRDAKRKPLPARLPIAVANSSRPFSYEDGNATVPQPQPQPQPRRGAHSMHISSAKNSPLPRLQLAIPPTPIERRSQIGLAVTSSTPPVRGRGRNVG